MRAGMTAIYGLADDAGIIRYVGKANDPEARFAQHMAKSRCGRTPVYAWIREQAAAGREIACVLLEWTPVDKWQEAERRVIARYRLEGGLLNVADGGNEPKNAEAQGPTQARIAQIKRTLSRVIRDEKLPASLRALLRFKMKLAAANNPALFGKWASL